MNKLLFDHFFALIQVSIGTREKLSYFPSNEEWDYLYKLAEMQSITGITFRGLELSVKSFHCKAPDILFEWIGALQYIRNQNAVQILRSQEISALFSNAGFRNCILKGQGTATYYQNPNDRQSGDIDIWVDGDRDEILSFVRSQGYDINSIDFKHSDIAFFDDIPVEVHFRPSWMYNPISNRRLQRFFHENSVQQFKNFDSHRGITRTTADFDLIFSMVHIYRHVFSEGIGLRQVMDYFFILKNSTKAQRDESCRVLKSLGMANFVGGIMWILKTCMGIAEELLLCSPNKKYGTFQLNEILISGNFGRYDDRFLRIEKTRRFERGLVQFRRNLSFVRYYPSEVLWSPIWKLWHYYWRKRKGYI